MHGAPTRGAALYTMLCARCHGPSGQGTSNAPPLTSLQKTEPALAAYIDAYMPKDDPGKCKGQCAWDTAAFLLQGFPAPGSTQAACTGDPQPAPRRLRLLTRREYRNTLRDLFRSGQPAAGGPPSSSVTCSSNADCDYTRQTCSAGACMDDACGTHTFVFPAHGQSHRTVHVAGSFNGWPGTIAAGGWPMDYVAGSDVWVTKHDLADGNYSYKFVLDESQWVTDPGNPSTQPDGFGGQNSTLTIACAGSAAGNGGAGAGSGSTGNAGNGASALQALLDQDPSQNLPVENRPGGFAFDNNVETGVVTDVHVQEYLREGAALAQAAVQSLDILVNCNPDADRTGCTTQFIQSFGKRAYRRPLSSDEVQGHLALAAGQPDARSGISVVLQLMLSSPYFLYRSELGEQGPDGTYQLTPHEVASALSYLFWGSMPDSALLDAADQGQLATSQQLETQARRLLADPRARDAMGVFALEWLGIEKVQTEPKSMVLYPSFDDSVRQAMLEETRRFFIHVLFDATHAYEELLTAKYSFINPTLAGLYGQQPPAGGDFAQADTAAERQAGLLTHASVLSAYAHSDQTSPILRGLFVRRQLLCEELPPPPPNAGGLPPVDPNATTRERFREHTANPACHACHQYIDNVGFGFEKFDAIGQFRTSENGQPIDASGDMNDVEMLGAGTDAPFSSLRELGSILAASHRAPDCYATQYYRFAMGYLEKPADACTVAQLKASFSGSGHNLMDLMVALVKAPTFVLRQ
jgi:hypothetical protein